MSENAIPGISIIIPVHNGGSAFIESLKSIKALETSALEIIVVGDGDTDGSSSAARQQGFKVLHSPHRQGPAIARNTGAQEATGEILFFLDADLTAPANVVGRVADNFTSAPDLAACFGSYDDLPADRGFLSQYRNLLHHYVHQTGSTEASTFWAGCGAVKRDIFLSINGFNPDYREPGIEDIELGYRLKKKGHRIVLDKGLLVKHLKKWTVLSLVKTDFWNRALPWTRLILAEGGFISDLNLKFENRLSVVFAFLLLMTLLLSLYSANFLFFALFSMLLLILLNWDLYKFFIRKRGTLFATGAVFWHWIHYLCSGIAFSIGVGEYGWRKIRHPN